MITSVVLKTMNFGEERNHHVRPAQPNTEGEKFQSDEMKKIYCCIKFLKKALDLDINSYWIKKELLREKYQSILDLCTEGTSIADKDDLALVRILSQSAFKLKLRGRIILERSLEEGFIHVRR